MRILFWGTPAFALPSLSALTGEGHDVVGVVTQPDRPAGRGRRLTPSPVKEAALAEGLTVLTPDRPRGDSFMAQLDALAPDLSVVVAYGHILRAEVLDRPRLGSLNVHASLLPELRGAAPIHWAVVRGHRETGVSIMQMTEGLDAGPVLLRRRTPIGPEDTVSDLTLRLAELGAEALVEALALLEAGLAEPEPQDDVRATWAPMIDRETARVDWTRSPRQVADHIRGMDRVPGAWTPLGGEPLKLFRPVVVEGAAGAAEAGGASPGTVLPGSGEEGLLVAAGTGDGAGVVRIGEVQPAGKRRMPAADWLRGGGVEPGQRLGTDAGADGADEAGS